MKLITTAAKATGKAFAWTFQTSFAGIFMLCVFITGFTLSTQAQLVIEIVDVIAMNGKHEFQFPTTKTDLQQHVLLAQTTPDSEPGGPVSTRGVMIEYKLSPNPATDSVTIGVYSPDILNGVDIYDKNGNNVFSESNPGRYTASGITAGIYTVHMHTNQGTLTDQLVVN